MSAGKTPIFLIGATGYIGGSVLSRLLSHRSADTFAITALVRSQEKAKLLESKFGVKAVIGSNDDLDKIEELSEQSHVVFSCADADNLKAIQAILAGLRKRHSKLGDLPTLIHTSGTGVLVTYDQGNRASETIYDDLDTNQIESLAPDQPHRNVDLALVQADKEGFVKTYIILPSTIYGIASNPLVEAGIQNPVSQQVPGLIRAAVGRGQGGMVGKGLAIWPHVHINDIADLYVVLFDAVVNGPDAVGHGREGFYFGENGEYTFFDVAKEIGKALVQVGIAKSDEPSTFTEEELAKYFGPFGAFFGTNSRCKANRSRSVGWKPKYTTEDFFASIQPEVENILAKQGGQK